MEHRDRTSKVTDKPKLPQILVLALFGFDALAILITYARLPAADTYHVSKTGLAGGAGRVLVFTNFPFALAAISLIGVAVLRIRASSTAVSEQSRRLLTWAAITGTILCLVTSLPGVVEQSDLDAKLVNVLPALGGMIALILTAFSFLSNDRATPLPWTFRDRIGVAIIAITALISLPWILAELGFYIDDIPLIGGLFMASKIPLGETLAAVHLGHHHGLDGFLFITAALILGRLLRTDPNSRLASALRGYLGLMFAYGTANLAQDAWLEQFVKRGWVDYRLPDFLRPQLSVGWGMLIAGAIAAWYLLFRPTTSTQLLLTFETSTIAGAETRV